MAVAPEDARVWVGRLRPGHAAEHARFLDWLNSDEAHELFRRRRLTEYALVERDGGDLTILFKAPRATDPRIFIDFLRYPGLWPDYWDFLHGGPADPGQAQLPPPGSPELKVHWRSP